MNIVEGLTATNLAVGRIKGMKEIDRSGVEEAFKPKRAEISNAQEDNMMSPSEAAETPAVLSAKLDRAMKCDVCPEYRHGRLQLLETHGHTEMGFLHFGVEIRTYQCAGIKCAVSQKRFLDPHGSITKVV